MDRRKFLSAVAAGAGAIAGLAAGVPLVGRLVSAARMPREEADAFQSVGSIDALVIGQPVRVAIPVSVRDGWEVREQVRAAWAIRTGENEAKVLSVVCPHLGCSVQWSGPRSEFGCPCHDSGFAADGARRHGPARRGLDALPTRLVGRDLQVQWVDYVANVAEKRPVGA